MQNYQNRPEGAKETIESGFMENLNEMYSYYLGQTKEATDDDRYNLITELIANIQEVQSIISKL